jgi:hypothetical protein
MVKKGDIYISGKEKMQRALMGRKRVPCKYQQPISTATKFMTRLVA